MENHVEIVELQDLPTGSGPDELVATENYTSFEADKAVKIRFGETKASQRKPISVVTAFRNTVTRYGDSIALGHKVDGDWVTISYREYYNMTIKMAKAFIKLGLEPHHGVGIIGFNSPEWLVSNMAAIFAGGLATGIYTTNSPEACLYVANNAKCDIVVVENDQQLQKFIKVRDQLSHVKAIVQYKGQLSKTYPDVYLWEDLIVSENDTMTLELENRIAGLAPNKCCTLIYTSGTTGNPKGVMLSHDNLIWSSTSLAMESNCNNKEVGVSYLPLSHIAAQLLDIYCSLVMGSSVYFAQPDALKGSLKNTLKEVRPTVFMGVPRVWEKMHESMMAIGKQSGFVKHSLVGWARNVGIKSAYSAMDGVAKGCMFSMADKLVFQKVKQALGLDRCRLMYSGAAPIMKETVDYFFSLNMPLLEAYGMSECTGIHSIAFPDDYYIGSVGKNYPGLENKFDGDHGNGSGEICMRGRHVFMGYLNEEEKTMEAIDSDGWLHSGDVGTVSSRGFNFITGRIKELLITSGGENIPPIPIEDKVREHLPCVSNCMLIGDKRKFLSILLTMKSDVDIDTMEPLEKLAKPSLDWCKSVGSDAKLVSDVTNNKDAKVDKAITAGIVKANSQATSRAQVIQKWAILPKDFSIPGGELGPTMKLKRAFVLTKYIDIVDKFYADAEN